jgi:hypothetical protein
MVLMWWVGCGLAALSAVSIAADSAPWAAAVVATMAAQAALIAGRTVGLPAWVRWPAALAPIAAVWLGEHRTVGVAQVLLVAALLVVADRVAALSGRLTGVCIPDRDCGRRTTTRTITLADPVAREFARARRDGSQLAVASVRLASAHGASRRLRHVAKALLLNVRRTDAIVRPLTDRLLIVLPGGDDDTAMAVVARALVGVPDDVLVGVATFPQDGPTWSALKDVARLREQPWPPASEPEPDLETAAQRAGRFDRLQPLSPAEQLSGSAGS